MKKKLEKLLYHKTLNVINAYHCLGL